MHSFALSVVCLGGRSVRRSFSTIPTPTPTQTQTPTPTPTPTPTKTEEGTPTPIPTPSPSFHCTKHIVPFIRDPNDTHATNGPHFLTLLANSSFGFHAFLTGGLFSDLEDLLGFHPKNQPIDNPSRTDNYLIPGLIGPVRGFGLLYELDDPAVNLKIKGKRKRSLKSRGVHTNEFDARSFMASAKDAILEWHQVYSKTLEMEYDKSEDGSGSGGVRECEPEKPFIKLPCGGLKLNTAYEKNNWYEKAMQEEDGSHNRLLKMCHPSMFNQLTKASGVMMNDFGNKGERYTLKSVTIGESSLYSVRSVGFPKGFGEDAGEGDGDGDGDGEDEEEEEDWEDDEYEDQDEGKHPMLDYFLANENNMSLKQASKSNVGLQVDIIADIESHYVVSKTNEDTGEVESFEQLTSKLSTVRLESWWRHESQGAEWIISSIH